MTSPPPCSVSFSILPGQSRRESYSRDTGKWYPAIPTNSGSSCKKVSPGNIVASAIHTVATNAKEKGIEIINLTLPELPLVQADADKSTWVLNNFLTNAVKYSFNNSKIEVKAMQENGCIVFSVKDFGPGIGEEYLGRLFERYFQVPGSKEKGTGLGLAISKEFVEAQKGMIWVESRIGEGSVFKFQLPLEHT